MIRITTAIAFPLLLAGCAADRGTAVVDRDDRATKPGSENVAMPANPATPRTGATPASAPIEFALAAVGLPEQGMWKCDPVFGDVNGDGHLDLAGIPRLGYGPQVWLGDGRGVWTEASNGLDPKKRSCGGGLAFADFNDDGHLDLAAADHCNGTYVYLGDGAGNWRMVTSELNPTDVIPEDKSLDMFVGSEDLDVGDVDGDGHLDLLVGGSDEGGLNVYLGDGTGQNWRRRADSLPNEGWANRVRLADVNGDRRLDAIASYSSGPRVWLNDGAGDWTEASSGLPTPIMQGLYHGLDVADFNADGRPDLTLANWIDGPEVYLQNSDGSWQKMPDVFPDMLGGAVGVAAGDMDHDGHVDIVTSGRLGRDGGYVRGTFVLLGDGRGGFTYVDSGLPDTGLSAVAGVALGDVNGDGWLDVAVGTGMNVESAPGPTKPVVPQRLLLWTSRPSGNASSLAAHPDE